MIGFYLGMWNIRGTKENNGEIKNMNRNRNVFRRNSCNSKNYRFPEWIYKVYLMDIMLSGELDPNELNNQQATLLQCTLCILTVSSI